MNSNLALVIMFVVGIVVGWYMRDWGVDAPKDIDAIKKVEKKR